MITAVCASCDPTRCFGCENCGCHDVWLTGGSDAQMAAVRMAYHLYGMRSPIHDDDLGAADPGATALWRAEQLADRDCLSSLAWSGVAVAHALRRLTGVER